MNKTEFYKNFIDAQKKDVRLGSNIFLGVRASNDYHSDYTFYEDGKKWNQGFILRIGAEW